MSRFGLGPFFAGRNSISLVGFYRMMHEIRSLYTPIQPTIQKSAEEVTYQEFVPDRSLQPYIYCYWQLKAWEQLQSPFSYRVVSDGCIDIFFNVNQPKESFVMGFCKKYTDFSLGDTFNYFGVRFLPTIFPQWYQIDASELSNQALPLHTIANDTAKYINDQVQPGQNAREISASMDEFFASCLANLTPHDDPRFFDALAIILDRSGVVQVETDLVTGLSPRQLRRHFNYYVGATTKNFCKVVRFQNILKAKPSQQSLRRNKLFYDLGYYDQAHFIKEFKSFYGLTPTQAFRRR